MLVEWDSETYKLCFHRLHTLRVIRGIVHRNPANLHVQD